MAHFRDNADVPETLRPLLSAADIRARVSALGREITADDPSGPGRSPLRLAGVLAGACFFVADLARAIERDLSLDFMRVRSYGPSTESSGQVRVTQDLEDDVRGLDVLLVDDIVDTGHTVEHLLGRLRQHQPRSLRVAALLNKPGRRVVPVTLDYVGFDIPDEFVVGYGLDYAGRYRNRPDISVLEGAAAGQR